MKLKRLCYVVSAVVALGLVSNASGAPSYNWSGAGDGITWDSTANWVQATVPTPDSFQIFIGTGYPTATPKPITIAASDVVQLSDSFFGPEWGETLDIYGTVTAGFGWFPIGDATAGTSYVNMYGNSSFTASDTVSLGDAWWFPGGPRMVMNLFDNSKVTGNYLWIGGHLNLYGGTMTIHNFVGAGTITGPQFTGGIDSDATRRVNIVSGTFKLPTGFTSTVLDWVNRNIFMAYGKAGSTNELVITDDGTNTIVTTLPLGGSSPVSVFIPPLNPANMVVGTVQQAKLLGNYPLVTNVLLSTSEPGVLPSSLPGAVTFSSSDPTVFTVTSNGVVTAVSPGTATLTAVMGTYTSTAPVTVIANNPILVHEYKFSETSGSSAADSIGGAPGMLNGDAAFSGTGQLVLSGNSGSSVTLPAGIVSGMDAVSVEAWVTFPGTNAPYANLFAFGETDDILFDTYMGDGENYITFSPHSTTNAVGNFQANFGIGLPGYNNEHDAVVVGTVLDNRANVHIVTVFNPLASTVAVYTNGVLAASDVNQAYYLAYENTTASPLASTLGADPNNYIGQSLYTTDPGLLATIDEFRIYNGALSAAQVAADYALGPNALLGSSTSVKLSAKVSGSNMVLKWPTSSALVTLMASSSLGPSASWSQVATGGSLTTDGSGNYQISIPLSGSKRFFRLQK